MKAYRYELECDNKRDLAKQLKPFTGVDRPNEYGFIQELLKIGRLVYVNPSKKEQTIFTRQPADVVRKS